MDVDTPGPPKLNMIANKSPESSTKKPKIRAKKRRRGSSDSSTDMDDVLPDNTLEVEKNLQALAIKNNLDDASVKKILKKVVTNDHVLALVKMREEEEDSGSEEQSMAPKLTRAKAKKLMKESPKLAPWNLELTPIKQLPVKTTPETTALIAKDLAEDEEDDEYQPTLDDVHSDDELTDLSCSDIDSQPRTPAAAPAPHGPAVVKDGPFIVPQELSTPTRKRLDEEEATIARRTRSKVSLSSTSLEQLEKSFIPPDEVMPPDVDNVWSEFILECLNPAPSALDEDDDDPEYNVAADPDAVDEDEEALENSIIKISKKELNDLVTELFHIMPEEEIGGKELLTNADLENNGSFNTTADTEQNNTANTEINNTDLNNTENSDLNTSNTAVYTELTNVKVAIQRWETKQETTSDSEAENQEKVPDVSEQIEMPRPFRVVSFGKTEPMDQCETEAAAEDSEMLVEESTPVRSNIEVEVRTDTDGHTDSPQAPSLLLRTVKSRRVQVALPSGNNVQLVPEQRALLAQQLRQHVQLSASSFLQLYVHPMHWRSAPTYKDFLVTLEKLAQEKSDSIAAVCNLAPALELVRTWEATLSDDTPQNLEMVRFLEQEIAESRRRAAQHSLYGGEFHPTFKKTIAHSPVFLYPYLLPPMPYRTDLVRKCGYVRSEDELIALGLDQFWQHVEDNSDIYKPRRQRPRARWGYSQALDLMCKVMFPWIPVRTMGCHITFVKKQADPDNPIIKFLRNREITPVKHSLLPFNPHMNLYQQPARELPPVWLRYAAESCSRAKKYLTDKASKLLQPVGVDMEFGKNVEAPRKKPLPPDFTKKIECKRSSRTANAEITPAPVQNPSVNTAQMYSIVNTSNGSFLVPLVVVPSNIVQTNVTNNNSVIIPNNLPEDGTTTAEVNQSGHCQCCVLLRSVSKRQTSIEEYFKPKTKVQCPCKSVKPVTISNKLRVLVNKYYRSSYNNAWNNLNNKMSVLKGFQRSVSEPADTEMADFVAATTFQLKLITRISSLTMKYDFRKRIFTLFSRFDPEADNPLFLAKELLKILEKDLIDLYKDFAAFLTAEQADKLDLFKEYFVQNCLSDIVERVEKEIPNKEERLRFLSSTSAGLSAARGACALGAALLRAAGGRPALARDIFYMFPHCQPPAPTQSAIITQPTKEQQQNSEPAQTAPAPADSAAAPARAAPPPDYEADHSSSENDASSEEDDSETETIADKFLRRKRESMIFQDIKTETASDPLAVDTSNIKAEEQDSDSSMSMMIMSENEEPKWTKQEDKVILQLLKESLSSEEMRGISVLEILEQTDIFDTLAESLTDKSRNEIQERVSYLLDMVVCSGTD